MNLSEYAVEQLDALIEQYESAGDGPRPQSLVVRLAAAIERLAPPGSAHARAALQAEGLIRSKSGYLLWQTATALRDDYAGGYVRSVEELVHADVFADFLDMADELQTKGFKDAAAVIAGSVLEEHLRKLAGRHGLGSAKPGGSPKKADALNTELATSGVYNKLVQKNVTAWLDLRNSAAHGKYVEYDHAQVAALIRDVREFMIRHPA